MNTRINEHGNVLFYILVAVALLAALIFAVSQSGRGSISQVNAEKSRMLATDIVDYATTVSNAVAQLRLRGCKQGQLSFQNLIDGAKYANPDAPSDKSCNVFEMSGGGVTAAKPSSEAAADAALSKYIFTDADAVSQVGSDCGTTSCDEVIMYTIYLKKDICTAINDLLKIDNPGGGPPSSSADTDIGGTMWGTVNSRISDTSDTTNAFTGKSAGCMYNSTGDQYVFYRVLQAN